MSEAPERIWAWPFKNWFRGGCSTHKVKVNGAKDVEYIRADLTKPRVKPLVWEEEEGLLEAKCIFGRYEIYQIGNKYVELLIGSMMSSIRLARIPLELDATLTDLKAAAQADYERRILEALE